MTPSKPFAVASALDTGLVAAQGVARAVHDRVGVADTAAAARSWRHSAGDEMRHRFAAWKAGAGELGLGFFE